MRMRKRAAAGRLAEPTLQRVLALLMFGWIVVVFGIAVLGYSGSTFTNAISFQVDDGWCVKGTESMGSHCFGDFGYSRSRGGEPEVYLPHNIVAAELPLTVVAFEGFRRFTYRTGLAIYMAIAIGSIAMVAWWGSRRRNVMERSVLFFAAGVASLGALVAFDRGNDVVWTAPFLLAYIVATERRAWRLAAASLAVLVALKVWGILLIVVLLAKRQYAWAARALVSIALLYVVPWLFIPGSILDKIKITLWAVTNRDYADQVVRYSVSPYSFLVRVACYARGPAVCDPVHPTLSLPGAPAFAVGCSLGLAVWAFVMCRRFDGSSRLLAYVPAISLVFLAVPEAAVYNLEATVIMFALLARWETDSQGHFATAGVSSDRKLAVWAMVIAMTVATLPLPIVVSANRLPSALLGDLRLTDVTVPVAWMVVVGMTIRLLIRERRVLNGASSLELSPGASPE